MTTSKKPAKRIKRTSDGMRTEYDLSKSQRNKFAGRFPRDVHYVCIEPDLAAFFDGTNAINNALRAMMTAIQSSANAKTKRAS